jgi:hypothetical protein
LNCDVDVTNVYPSGAADADACDGTAACAGAVNSATPAIAVAARQPRIPDLRMDFLRVV